MAHSDTIAVLDFGGQYAHLIANRIRRLGVYSEIVQCDADASALGGYKGIILSGSPHSTLAAGSPTMDAGILNLNIPVLGLCYGHQLIVRLLGGSVAKGTVREYGRAFLTKIKDAPLFAGLVISEQVWMSHGDTVETLPAGFSVIGTTEDCRNAAVGDLRRNLYGLQFHPEVTDTHCGMKILGNFIDICKCARTWNTSSYIKNITDDLRRYVGNRKVFLLVSGGVDSSVAFTLLNKVLGSERVLGLHIDNGLMRLGESADILEYMKKQGFNNLSIEHAGDAFLEALRGVIDPEEKRKIIGTMFITAKERAAEKLGLNPDEWILAQGTIYPDTIESAGTKHADRIKTHHNRVDVILDLIERGLVIEPLSQLYKDEVRELGESLGLPKKLVWRHPFPGPGLGVRVLCSDGNTEAIDPAVSQKVGLLAVAEGYKATILPIRSVGVQGDGRTYAHPVLVTGPLDWQKLDVLSTRITNMVRAVNRIVYGLNTVGNPSYSLIVATLTKERLDKLRAIDHCVTEALFAYGEYDTVWQMPVVLLPLVNAEGNECVVLRPIVSQEAMTATFVPLKPETIELIVNKAKEIEGIGDIFFDVTHKPPGTIEWE